MTSATVSAASTRIRSDICIVGNGAIAKTAALGLAQAGHSVTLLAPAPVPATPGAGTDMPWDVRVYALNHTAHRLLTGLRVWDALDHTRVEPVEAMQVHGDGGGAGALGFDAFGARAGALAWIVEDRNLNQALDAALRFAPNVRASSGRATALATGADHASITLADGAIIECDLVLGADGAESWVRSQCDIGYDYRSYHQSAIVTNFSCAKPHRGIAYQWFTGDEGIVALLPLPGQRVSLVWSAPTELAATLMSETLSELAVRLALLCEAELGPLRPLVPEELKAFPLRLIRPHSMVADKVVLIGDAAHVVHPLAGHGMNLGFGDVDDLLKVLAAREPQRALGEPRLLARYARARKEDVLLMQLATDGLERLFGANLEPLRAARNFGLNLLDKIPSLKRRLIAQAMGE